MADPTCPHLSQNRKRRQKHLQVEHPNRKREDPVLHLVQDPCRFVAERVAKRVDVRLL